MTKVGTAKERKPRLRVEYRIAKNKGLHFALIRSNGTFLIKGWMRRNQKDTAKVLVETYIKSEYGELLPYEVDDQA